MVPLAIDAAVDRGTLAEWLIRHHLAGIGFASADRSDPRLAALLKPAALGEAAGTLGHADALDRIEQRFERECIPMVVLKGAAFAFAVYRDSALRSMSDLDIWLLDEDIGRAGAVLRAMGFCDDDVLPDRPDELQRHASGEVAFRRASGAHGRIEIHYGAFQGFWARRTAAPDTAAVWRRAEPVGPDRHARRLGGNRTLALLQASFQLHLDDEDRSRELFERLGAVVDSIPVRRLIYPRDFKELGAVREAVIADAAELAKPARREVFAESTPMRVIAAEASWVASP